MYIFDRRNFKAKSTAALALLWWREWLLAPPKTLTEVSFELFWRCEQKRSATCFQRLRNQWAHGQVSNAFPSFTLPLSFPFKCQMNRCWKMWRTCHFDVPLQIHQALIVQVGSAVQGEPSALGFWQDFKRNALLWTHLLAVQNQHHPPHSRKAPSAGGKKSTFYTPPSRLQNPHCGCYIRAGITRPAYEKKDGEERAVLQQTHRTLQSLRTSDVFMITNAWRVGELMDTSWCCCRMAPG